MTKQQAEKIVTRLNEMTSVDLVEATTESEEFQKLHAQLVANGWGTLCDEMERKDDGRCSGVMRLVRTTDPEWIRRALPWR